MLNEYVEDIVLPVRAGVARKEMGMGVVCADAELTGI